MFIVSWVPTIVWRIFAVALMMNSFNSYPHSTNVSNEDVSQGDYCSYDFVNSILRIEMTIDFVEIECRIQFMLMRQWPSFTFTYPSSAFSSASNSDLRVSFYLTLNTEISILADDVPIQRRCQTLWRQWTKSVDSILSSLENTGWVELLFEWHPHVALQKETKMHSCTLTCCVVHRS